MGIESPRTRMFVVFLTGLWAAHVAVAGDAAPRETALVFKEVPSQTREFIGYYHSISLNAEQTKLKEAVLGSIPAGCCGEFSILTCCCPCNFAKSVWGLSHYAIVKLHYNADQLRQAVLDWTSRVNPAGFTGDACHRGGCGRSFVSNGCGGMDEKKLVF